MSDRKVIILAFVWLAVMLGGSATVIVWAIAEPTAMNIMAALVVIVVLAWTFTRIVRIRIHRIRRGVEIEMRRVQR